MAAGYDGSIKIDTKINSKGFNTGVSSMMSSLKGLASMVGVAFGVSQIIRFGKASIGLASDLQEVQNVVDVTFGEGNKKIEQFTKSAIENFGLSELSAKRYASTMGAMLKSSGVTQKAVEDMSISITGLTGDIASFYNLDTETAFLKIRSGISGETEPLKQLGINLNVANLEAFALSQGITKSYNSMSQAEQVMLRYNYLLSVTKDAQGDFVRTQDSWANQTRILSERYSQFKAILGKILMQTLVPFLKVLNSGISILISFGNALARALGIESDTSVNTSSSMIDGIDSAVSGQEDLASSIEDTTKAQEELNRSVASFDKLNDITKNKTSTSSGGGSGVGGSSGFDLSSPYLGKSMIDTKPLETASEKIKKVFKDLKDINFDKLINSFNNLKKSLEPFKENFFSALDWLWVNILLPMAEWVIEDFIPKFLNLLAAGLDALDAVIEAGKPMFSWLWETFLKPLGQWAGDLIIKTIEWLTEKLTDFSDWARNNQETMDLMFSIILGFFAGIVMYATYKKLSTLVNGITTAIKAFGVQGLIAAGKLALPILAVSLLAAGIIYLWKNWDKLTVPQRVITILGALAAAATTAALAIAVFHTSWTVGIAAAAIVAGLALLVGTWASLKYNKSSVGLGITEQNSASDMSRKGLSMPTSALNMSKTLSGSSTSVIPKLAQGAVIPANSEFLAILGDQKSGRNLEAPEGLIRQIVREESGTKDNDMMAIIFSAIKMASDAGLLSSDVIMDSQKVGKMTAPAVGNEFNRSGFVLRTAKG